MPDFWWGSLRKFGGTRHEKSLCQQKQWISAASANAEREKQTEVEETEAEVGRFCYELRGNSRASDY
jgi:hypothetical protein